MENRTENIIAINNLADQEENASCRPAHSRRMPIAERAKQFMPFAGVAGLDQALEVKEREVKYVLETPREPFEEPS